MAQAVTTRRDTSDESSPGIQHEAFDVLAAGMMKAYSTSYGAAQLLARELNGRGSHLVSTPEQIAIQVEHLSAHLARIVISDPETTSQEKWGIQQDFHQRAMLWSRVASVMRKYVFCDPRVGNALAGDGFVTGAGYADPRMQRRAEIVGNIMRWLDAHGSRTLEEQLIAITGLLATGQAGVEATAGNSTEGKPFARLTVATPA